MKRIITVLLAAMCALAIFGCAGNGSSGSNDVTFSRGDVETISDDGFHMDYPSTWTKSESSEGHTIIILQSPDETGLVTINVAAPISEVGFPKPDPDNVDSWASQMAELMSSTGMDMGNYDISSENGIIRFSAPFSADTSGETMTGHLYVFYVDGLVYSATLGAFEGAPESVTHDLDEMARSISVS